MKSMIKGGPQTQANLSVISLASLKLGERKYRMLQQIHNVMDDERLSRETSFLVEAYDITLSNSPMQ